MTRPILGLLALVLFSAGAWFLTTLEDPGAATSAAAGAAVRTEPTDRAVPDPEPRVEPAGREAAAAEARPAGEPPASFTASLGAIVGRVLDHDRTPLAKLPLELVGGNLLQLLPDQRAWFEDELPDVRFVAADARTDDEGRFRFDGIDPKGYFLIAIDIGGPRATYELVDLPPAPGAVVDVGDIVLPPYVTLIGRVVDEDDEPVAGARVRATQIPVEAFTFGLGDVKPGCAVGAQVPPAADWTVFSIPPIVFRVFDRLPIHETRSGEDGTFRLAGVPIGTVTLHVDRSGYTPVTRGPIPTGSGGDREVPDLRLGFGQALVGRVVRGIEGEEEPVAGAEILAGVPIPFFPAALLVPVATSDESGAFRAPGLRDTEHTIAVRGPDEATWQVQVGVVPGLDEPTIRLDPTTHVDVTARDASGEILRHPHVTIQPVSEMGTSFLLVPPLPIATRKEARDDGSVHVFGLAPAEYRILVRANGFSVRDEKVDLRRGAVSIDVVLPPERRGHVQVVAREDGRPIEWAAASVYLEESDDNPIEIAPLVTRRTDRNGVAVLEGLPEGEMKVAIFHPAYAIARATLVAPGPPIRVELGRGGVLAGHVYKGGALVPEPYWVLAIPAGGEQQLPRWTRTDDEGAYEMTHLEAGLYEVAAMERRRLADIGGMDFDGGGPWSGVGLFAGTKVEVESSDGELRTGAELEADRAHDADGMTRQATIVEGGTTVLDIDVQRLDGTGPRGRVLGRVLVNGRPAADLAVEATEVGREHRSRDAYTNDAGVFDLGEVFAGDLRVVVRRGSGEREGILAVRALHLEPSAVETVEFSIETGYVRGRVRAARDGAPIPYARVHLFASGEAKSDGIRLQTATDEHGAFELEIVPQGTYSILAEARGFARGAGGEVVVPARGAPPPIDLMLAGAVDVEGRVELPAEAGSPPYLFVYFDPVVTLHEEQFGGFARVDPETMRFHVEDIDPGEYEVRVFGSDQDLGSVKLRVPVTGLSAAVVRPEPVAPVDVVEPPPDEAGSGG